MMPVISSATTVMTPVVVPSALQKFGFGSRKPLAMDIPSAIATMAASNANITTQ
jgi:hypothetical protein